MNDAISFASTIWGFLRSGHPMMKSIRRLLSRRQHVAEQSPSSKVNLLGYGWDDEDGLDLDDDGVPMT